MVTEILTRLANLPWSGYIPQQPTPKQLAFLALDAQEAFYGGAAGGGKALTLDTPVPTPTGWSSIGALVIGDMVVDDRGLPCRVTSKSRIFLDHRLYRMHFDDGTTIVADGAHRWQTYSYDERAAVTRRTDQYRQKRRSRRPSRANGTRPHVGAINAGRIYPLLEQPTGTVRTTEDIAASLYHNGRLNHAIRVALPLQLPERSLPVDPYILGVWLGDGTSSGGSITTADDEIVKALDWAGYQPRHRSSAYGIGTRGLATQLRQMELIQNKHIPATYLRGSESQRRALLMGLMDTDGTCDKDGGCQFTSTSHVLASGVLELVRSLGIKAHWSESRARLYGKDCGPNYKIKFTTCQPVFRLPRKAHRQPQQDSARLRWHYITVVEPVDTEPVQCITVDSPSHLFLVGHNMVPTHNSSALLMAALQYVDIPGYAAILFRRSYTDLALPGALMDRAHDWLGPTDAHWSAADKTWTFPSGATISFGYMDNENAKYRYQGAEFAFIGFDETTQFTESQYRFLFSRLRRLESSDIPLRMRAASNPGGIGHDWVRQRFITEGPTENRPWVPAALPDNPFLDRATYINSLMALDPITRAQLLNGDWSARQSGGLFRREWFEILDVPPAFINHTARYWDLAATEAKPGTDPDWTVGVLLGEYDNIYYLLDIQRMRGTPAMVERLIRQTAEMDGTTTPIFIEQEPGSSGVNTIDHYVRRVLPGWTVRGRRSTGSKVERANPVSSQAEAGNIKLVRSHWIGPFLDEVEGFPIASHDDQVDALSGAFGYIVRGQPPKAKQHRRFADQPSNHPLGLTGEKYRDTDTREVPR